MNRITRHLAAYTAASALAFSAAASTRNANLPRHLQPVTRFEQTMERMPELSKDVLEYAESEEWKERQRQYTMLLGKDKELQQIMSTYIVEAAQRMPQHAARNSALLLVYILEEQVREEGLEMNGHLPKVGSYVAENLRKIPINYLEIQIENSSRRAEESDSALSRFLKEYQYDGEPDYDSAAQDAREAVMRLYSLLQEEARRTKR